MTLCYFTQTNGNAVGINPEFVRQVVYKADDATLIRISDIGDERDFVEVTAPFSDVVCRLEIGSVRRAHE